MTNEYLLISSVHGTFFLKKELNNYANEEVLNKILNEVNSILEQHPIRTPTFNVKITSKVATIEIILNTQLITTLEYKYNNNKGITLP